MKVKENQFVGALEHLYRAALEPQAWVAFMDEFSKVINARGGHYYLWDQQMQGITFAIPSSGYSLELQAEAADYWHSKDRMFKQSLTREGEGKWFVNNRFFDKHYLASDPFHNEFLYPNDIYHVTGYRSSSTTPVSSALGFLRGGDQGPMGDSELAWLRRLKPHLEIAGRLHREMLYLKLSATMQAQTLDTLDYPIFLVYENGFIAFHNRAAERWLTENHVITAQSYRLTGRTTKGQASLDRLLDGVFERRASGVQAVPRSSGEGAYQMMVLPLNPSSRLGAVWQRPLALVVVSDPLARSPLTGEQLQALFGLTPAEARVAMGLAEGRTLEKVAEEGRVTMNTARSQLKQAMEKTGARRQAELVKTVNALPNINVGGADE
ncbi:MAG TPA: hypothetical protein VKA13_04205 [Gammaproteobacteria bacterium]|nr:hypothetical protein [Gammaproteobacteria bacterium]